MDKAETPQDSPRDSTQDSPQASPRHWRQDPRDTWPAPRPDNAPRPRLRDRLREKLPELLLEAASVVFAVLLALGVDEWRDNRAKRAFATRAQESIVNELRANRRELAGLIKDNKGYFEDLQTQIETMRKKTVHQVNTTINLAQFSSAAWETAQSTQASQLMDFNWLVKVATVYEGQKLYVQAQTEILTSLSDIAGMDTQAQRLRLMLQLSKRMELMLMLATQLDKGYDEADKSTPAVFG